MLIALKISLTSLLLALAIWALYEPLHPNYRNRGILWPMTICAGVSIGSAIYAIWSA